MLAGLAFKVSAVPFHMWTPDVYEGAPTPVTAFFATAPKVAAMALLARLAHDAFGAVPGDWGQIVAFLAVASMFVGSIAAIGQRDIKRLMAYSSIAHMGYALIGLAAGTVAGVQAMLIYMAIYVTMNIGVFAFILSMSRDGRPVTDIDALNLYAKRESTRGLALMVLMISLAGVPPFLGFWAKYAVLLAAVQAGMVWLAIAAVIASVIGLYYYLRIVYLMYFGQERPPLDAAMPALQSALLVGAAAIMVLGVVNLFGVEGFAALAAESLVR
jgi:NADH-quinone oxidoreductase subunit N